MITKSAPPNTTQRITLFFCSIHFSIPPAEMLAIVSDQDNFLYLSRHENLNWRARFYVVSDCALWAILCLCPSSTKMWRGFASSKKESMENPSPLRTLRYVIWNFSICTRFLRTSLRRRESLHTPRLLHHRFQLLNVVDDFEKLLIMCPAGI